MKPLHIQVINLINVIYVVKSLVWVVAYRHTLEQVHIQAINLINVMYVAMYLCTVNKEFLDHIIMYLFNLMFKVYNNVQILKILWKSSKVNNCILLVKKEHTACYYFFYLVYFCISCFYAIANILRSYIVLCYWSVVRLLCVLCPSVVGNFFFVW